MENNKVYPVLLFSMVPKKSKKQNDLPSLSDEIKQKQVLLSKTETGVVE
jgi:hypothetical protein